MTNIKKQFQGRSAHRYKDNPLEKAFALAWQKQNDARSNPISHSLLDYLLDKENKGCPDPPTSARDWEVANTVVQWLGSPVGQGFLRDILTGDSRPARSFREDLLADALAKLAASGIRQ